MDGVEASSVQSGASRVTCPVFMHTGLASLVPCCNTGGGVYWWCQRCTHQLINQASDVAVQKTTLGSFKNNTLTSSSIRRPMLTTDSLGTMSLPTTTQLTKPWAAWLRLALMSPPGGQKAQHLVEGNLSFRRRVIKAATPAPRL